MLVKEQVNLWRCLFIDKATMIVDYNSKCSGGLPLTAIRYPSKMKVH
jgi:hypothetical protein